MKRLGILGSTGSIGVNCLKVVESLPVEFEVVYLAAHSNVALLHEQTRRFRPRAVAIVQPPQANVDSLRAGCKELGAELLFGVEALVELAARDDIDVLVNAVVGSAGLPATLRALENGTTVALANKETLVTGGELVMSCAKRHSAPLIPIDSEHSALWQCLLGEPKERIQRLIVTASGGPFRERAHKDFAKITVAEALHHPNWNMGPKITIDSATMMNKGLEVIEAFWLFGLALDKIDVVIHPQSIIHSMVEFVDGSVKAQLSVPDMRMPIQYALTYPDRLPSDFPRLDFSRWHTLTFHAPDFDKFPCLQLATQALQEGGTAPAVLNAANEEAVQAFLEARLRFDQIPAMISETLQQHRNGRECSLANVLAADRWARGYVQKFTPRLH